MMSFLLPAHSSKSTDFIELLAGLSNRHVIVVIPESEMSQRLLPVSHFPGEHSYIIFAQQLAERRSDVLQSIKAHCGSRKSISLLGVYWKARASSEKSEILINNSPSCLLCNTAQSFQVCGESKREKIFQSTADTPRLKGILKTVHCNKNQYFFHPA